MNPDWIDMLSALSAEGAEFLLVGAHARAVHGSPRATASLRDRLSIYLSPGTVYPGLRRHRVEHDVALDGRPPGPRRRDRGGRRSVAAEQRTAAMLGDRGVLFGGSGERMAYAETWIALLE